MQQEELILINKIEYFSQFLLEYQQQQNEEKEKIKRLIAPSHPPAPGQMPPMPYRQPQHMNGYMNYPPPPMNGVPGHSNLNGPGYLPPPPPGSIPNRDNPNGQEGSRPEGQGSSGGNSQLYPPPPRESVPVEVKREDSNNEKFNPLMSLNISAAKNIATKTE
eukprot:CAMPEP_0197014344 /NCGR_PEP_ID=MMETSP1380-20130617/69964_1 /TAXON_ID=5936 /ORGANISM="Euplotes crassus, Strain CT5" /LENGTH=161 /DNA_ID=CAMNT_0042439315 /DNA_START=98 /DNA_END=583 /DNA_ORIENTATION=+